MTEQELQLAYESKVQEIRETLANRSPEELALSQHKKEVMNLRRRIQTLKNKLSNTDYKAIKYAEGLISEDEYVEIKNQRQLWRDEINTLEEQLANIQLD